MVSESVKQQGKRILEVLGGLEHFENLVFVYLFGSRVNGKPLADSDLDVCCYYDLDRQTLAEHNIKVASAFPDDVDVSLFQLMPLQTRQNVFKGELIHSPDKKRVYDIAIKTFNEYRLYRPLYLQVIS